MDRTLEDTFYVMFTTRAFATGIPGTLGGSPVVSAYEDNSVTQITAGITLGVNHDSVTGLNLLTIVATAANGYESGKDYSLIITTGTVDSVSVVGEVVGEFSIGLSAAAVDLANATDGLGAIKAVVDSRMAEASINTTAGAVDNVTAVATTTTNTDMVSEPQTAVQNRQEMDSNSTELAKIGTIPALDGAGQTIGAAIAKIADDNAGADFDATTDSLQALRARGDAAWITGGGGGITDIVNISLLIPLSIDLADTATYRLGIMLINSLDDLPSAAEITPGTISIDRKAIGGTSWSSIVSDAACSEIAGLVYYDEVFDSGAGYVEGDTIRVTFKSQKITVAANDYEIIGATGRIFYTSIRQTMRGTNSALLAANINLTAGVLDEVALVTGHTPQTADHAANIAAILADTLPLGYLGPEGYGIYVDGAAANTNTVDGVDGIFSNPVSTLAAARTLADSLGIEIYYILNNSDLTLAATHVDWEFVGFGAMTDNTINLGSQDVSRSRFLNVVLEGTQGGAGRIEAERCALQDPGAGVSTFHIFALGCGIVDDITLDTSNDNVFVKPFSLVAGDSAPIIRASGASGTLQLRGMDGGVDFRDLSASHNMSISQVGQVIFDASCNVNANVTLYGIGTITDNTAGMASLTQGAYINMSKINTEADTALTDFFTSAAQLIDDIWDEVISKALHNIAGSAAKILRQSGDLLQIDGAVSDVAPTTTDFDTDLTQPDTYFADAIMIFTNGAANAGIGKAVSTYVNASGHVVFVAAMAWPVTPVNGDDFVIFATHSHPVSEIQSGLATEAKQDVMDINIDQIEAAVITNATGADIAADIIAMKAETVMIVEDTNELQTDLTNGGRLDLLIDRLITEIDTSTGEPGQGAPPASTKRGDKIDYLYKWTRNLKDNDGSLTQFYDDAGTTVDHKQITSEAGGTVTKAEIAAGP